MDQFAEINITPFTDVLLVLLIIFVMMAALIAPVGFERQFSCNCMNRPIAVAPYQAALDIDARGRMSLEGERIDERTIYVAMKNLRNKHRRLTVDIFALARTPYGAIIRAMDAAKAADINDVAFAVL